MASKNNPGKFDCYAAAAPDEPIFTLRANDELAPYIVRIWTMIRFGGDLAEIMGQLSLAKAAAQKKPFNLTKMEEAMECAMAMEKWKKSHGE